MHTNRQRAPQGVGRAAAGLRPASDICARSRQKSKKRNKTLQQSQGDRFGWAKRNPQAPGLESTKGRHGSAHHARGALAVRKRQTGTGPENAYPYVGILQRVHSLSDHGARIPKEASRPARALMQRAAHYAGQRIDVQVFRVLISPLRAVYKCAGHCSRRGGLVCFHIFPHIYFAF